MTLGGFSTVVVGWTFLFPAIFLNTLLNGDLTPEADFLELLALDAEEDIPDRAITVSHFLIAGLASSSSCFEENLRKLLVEKLRCMDFSVAFFGGFSGLFGVGPKREFCTKFFKLGTLGRSDIEVRVSQSTTC